MMENDAGRCCWLGCERRDSVGDTKCFPCIMSRAVTIGKSALAILRDFETLSVPSFHARLAQW